MIIRVMDIYHYIDEDKLDTKLVLDQLPFEQTRSFERPEVPLTGEVQRGARLNIAI